MQSKVFFIDDDSVALMINRKLVDKALPEAELLTALNGRDAINYYDNLLETTAIASSCPSLILLDLNMPIMDGWDFLEEFSRPRYSCFNQTKIVVLSSSINPEDFERSKQYPMVVDFIAKPVTLEILQQYNEAYLLT